MYNFLDSTLLPKVSTKTACLEGFEVENLVHVDFVRKGRGFIAYATIRPPVDVDFEFICNINLSHIVIHAKNGNQKISGVEILAKTPTTQYVTISKANFDEDGIIVCNARKYSRNKRPENTDKDFHLVFFKSNEFRTFLNTSSIRIRILKTPNMKTPCLGRVEIWGLISKTCSQVTIDTVHKLLNKTNTINGNPLKSAPSCSTKEFKVPDEFLDEITYEVMSLPMTLPSGHTVDQTTLEKCYSTDASCGRHPTDPFTGLKFSQKRVPLLNVALKSRIDMFLLQNSNQKEIFSVKRTLGRAGLYCDGESESNKKLKGEEINKKSVQLDNVYNIVLNSENFIRFSSDDKCNLVNLNKMDKCGCCENSNFLYVTTCKHVYCRKCLTLNNNFCVICKLRLGNNQITRYHF
ncbi:RING finger protein 37 [Onthophagus taurus]|uniref:RING finger protein 37 n=1 Tax=Onthophagus taurus TaxID=166361 RepID=UPI0039BE0994